MSTSSPDDATAAQIRKGLRGKDTATLFGTFCQARELGPDMIELAAEVIFDPGTTPLMRYWATELVATLAGQRSERSRVILLGSLSDHSPLVRAAALNGLASFHDELNLMCIGSYLEDHAEIEEAWDTPFTVSEAAQASLAKIAAATAR